MPAGDMLTGDYQAELVDFLMGDTTTPLGPGPIDGLGSPRAKTADVGLDGADGSYASADFLSSRVLTVPFIIVEDDADSAMGVLADANDAWAPVSTDVELHIQLPGWGHFKVSGRPRELDVDLSLLHDGTIFCLGTFEALDPTITTVDASA